ncbi:MAG: signal peptidase I [Clostridia bacterium]|nr:signal peptidase I [Clostridia bacterium]
MNNFNEEFIQYDDKKAKSETKSLTWYLFSRITLYIAILFLGIFFAWYTVFISTHSFYAVEGPSMMQALNSKITDEELLTLPTEQLQKISYDAVYVDRVTKKPQIYDMVVIQKSSGENVIKRLMAQEGDYVTIAKSKTAGGEDCLQFYRIPKEADLTSFTDEDAKVDEVSGENGYSIRSQTEWLQDSTLKAASLNGAASNAYCQKFYNAFLDDIFYSNGADGYEHHVSSNGLVYVKVPEGKCFYLGDNRAYSADSRETGFASASSIVGRAEFIVYDYNFGNRLLEVVKFYFSEMQKFFAR